MQILITGANGFLGKNLRIHVSERDGLADLPVTRDTSEAEIVDMLDRAEVVVHLAGVNRSESPVEFETGNADLTARLCRLLISCERKLPVIYSSSIQAGNASLYGRSKRGAERHLEAYSAKFGAPVAICRLANVFGKWCRPNYNSVVATFCHNISRGLSIKIDDRDAPLQLVYVDDVIMAMLDWIAAPGTGLQWPKIGPVWKTTVGALADQLLCYRDSRESLVMKVVGVGLGRALYATYLSYFEPKQFTYPLVCRGDERGLFVEMLKTEASGQVSYFTAHPGVTRGGHYHHTKNEKFIVLQGQARFRFRNLITGEVKALETSGEKPVVVTTVPGWAHDITNIGYQELLVVLWANEIFDCNRPDTFACELTG